MLTKAVYHIVACTSAQDGVDILRSERICAKRQLPELLHYVQSHQDDTQASPCRSDDDSGMAVVASMTCRIAQPTCEQFDNNI